MFFSFLSHKQTTISDSYPRGDVSPLLISLSPGNTGEELAENPDLYISRDGGITWEETLAGSWGVTMADHGGLLVAASDYHADPSSTIMYSCNEGVSWQSYDFSNFDFGNTYDCVRGSHGTRGAHDRRQVRKPPGNKFLICGCSCTLTLLPTSNTHVRHGLSISQ